MVQCPPGQRSASTSGDTTLRTCRRSPSVPTGGQRRGFCSLVRLTISYLLGFDSSPETTAWLRTSKIICPSFVRELSVIAGHESTLADTQITALTWSLI